MPLQIGNMEGDLQHCTEIYIRRARHEAGVSEIQSDMIRSKGGPRFSSLKAGRQRSRESPRPSSWSGDKACILDVAWLGGEACSIMLSGVVSSIVDVQYSCPFCLVDFNAIRRTPSL